MEPIDQIAGAGELQRLLERSERAHTDGGAADGRDQAELALALARRHGERGAEARALLLKGQHEFRLGHGEGALRSLTRAAELFLELGDDRGRSEALARTVLALHSLGQSQQALEVSELAVQCARRCGDRAALALAYASAGTAHDAVGDHAAALAATDLACDLAHESGDQSAIFSALNNRVVDLLGLAAAAQQGDGGERRRSVERAIEAGERALAVAQQLGAYQQVLALVNLGEALRVAGRLEEAHRMCSAAATRAKVNGFRSLFFSARETCARVAQSDARLVEAATMFERLLFDATQAGEVQVQLQTLRSLSEVHRDSGDHRLALAYLEQFCELEQRRRSTLAETRARMLSDRIELERLQRATELATRDAEAERARARDLEQQKRALQQRTEELLRRADQDSLTGLWNRGYAERVLPQLLRAAREHAAPVSVLMVDADHFKAVNDGYGHNAGDEVLRRIAGLMSAQLRPVDTVARYGGEEFIVVLPGASAQDAGALAERLCAAVGDAAWDVVVAGGTPTISVGVASAWPDEMVTLGAEELALRLVARADAALYQAKRAGRNRVVATGA